MSPRNPSLADKLYRQAPIREPDATRASTSPLGGVAQPATATSKEKRG
jgi:hypothetical protein